MPAANTSSDYHDPGKTTSFKAIETDATPTNAVHTQAPAAQSQSAPHTADNRTPQKPTRTTLSDNGYGGEPQTTAMQSPMHHERRERNLTGRNYRPARDGDSRSKAPDSTRNHPSAETQPQRPPQASEELNAARPNNAQTQASLPPQPTGLSDGSWEEEIYVESQDVPMQDQSEDSKAAPRTHQVRTDYASATAAGGQSALPRDPHSSLNAQIPPTPPPPNTRPGEYPHRIEMKEAQPVQRPSSRYGFTRWLPSGSSDATHDKWKDEYHKLAAECQRARDDLKRAEGEIRYLRRSCQDLDTDRNRHKENSAALQNELKNVKRELEDYRTLSEIRGKELVGAQVFLTKADQLSASELGQKVSELNEENFQAAAWLSESLVHLPHRFTSEEDYKGTCQRASSIIGEPAVTLLQQQANDPELNILVIQLVMQIFLTKFVMEKIESWYEGGPETNNFLGTLYGEIRRTEEQAVSGRWRAITHAHTRPSPDPWMKELTHKLNAVMGIASWDTPNDKHATFEQKLRPVFKAVLDLRIALGEHFTSADIEVYCPSAGAPFDPQSMEDALDDGRGKAKNAGTSSAASTIFGTSGLGLHEVRKEGDELRIVLAPKVIPQSTLDELLNPAPTKPKKSKSAPHAG